MDRAAKYATSPRPTDRMPGGVPYIVGNEAAERFSFYGMKAILFVFMTEYLLGADGTTDVLSADQAKEYVHYFVSAAYFFPVLGALLSDTLLGKYRTILVLSIVYCLGHLALAVNETRLGLAVGLGLIALGSGGIKPCVSAHVGDQFGIRNKHLMTRVFQWFYFAINLGAFASTILTPILLVKFGPGVAFGVPGVLMFIATVLFWLGRHEFVHIPPSGTATLREFFSRRGALAILNLAVIYLFVAVFWALFDQTGSAWIDQARRMDRQWLGIMWYPSQVQAANPILILIFIPLFAYVIYPAIDRVFSLTPLRKIAIGFFVCVAAFAVPAWIESRITGGEIVPFKQAPEEEATHVAAEIDKDNWPVGNLIDGRVEGSGWAAPMEGLQDLVIRLRERRAWEINAVELTPADVRPLLAAENPKANIEMGDSDACRPREVEVLVSSARVGPWQSVARNEFAVSESSLRLAFPAVTAEFVMLRLHSNHGGPLVSLAEVAVHTTEPASPAATTKADLWPNVAAVGTQPNIAWQLLAYVLLTAAEIMISITCLEFSYTQAPKAMKSLIMSFYLLSVSLGNLFTAGVNRFIQNPDGSSKLEGADYYWFFTALVLAAAVGFLVVAFFYRGKTYIQGTEDKPDA